MRLGLVLLWDHQCQSFGGNDLRGWRGEVVGAEKSFMECLILTLTTLNSILGYLMVWNRLQRLRYVQRIPPLHWGPLWHVFSASWMKSPVSRASVECSVLSTLDFQVSCMCKLKSAAKLSVPLTACRVAAVSKDRLNDELLLIVSS